MIIKICYKNENPISHKTYDTYMPIKIIDGKPYEVIKDAKAAPLGPIEGRKIKFKQTLQIAASK